MDLQTVLAGLSVLTRIEFHLGSGLDAPPALAEDIDLSRKLKYLNVEGDRCCARTRGTRKKHACGRKVEPGTLSAHRERKREKQLQHVLASFSQAELVRLHLCHRMMRKDPRVKLPTPSARVIKDLVPL